MGRRKANGTGIHCAIAPTKEDIPSNGIRIDATAALVRVVDEIVRQIEADKSTPTLRRTRSPAEDLAELNANIVGPIEVIAEFRGPTVTKAERTEVPLVCAAEGACECR